MRTFLILISLVLAVPGFSQEKTVRLATLNCYWFFNGDDAGNQYRRHGVVGSMCQDKWPD